MFVIEAFNKAMVDIRSGTTVTGDIEVGPLSTFRSRSNTVTGDIEVFGVSGLGLRNSVTYTGTITCFGNSFTFSNNGGPYNCNTGPHSPPPIVPSKRFEDQATSGLVLDFFCIPVEE